MFAYANVDLAVLGDLPPNFLAVGAVFIIATRWGHLAVSLYLAPYADPFLLPAAALLNLLGLAMIRRLDLADEQRAARQEIGTPSPDVVPQLTWTALALALFVAILFFVHDHRRLQKYTYTAMVLGVLLLLSPLIPGLARRSTARTCGSGLAAVVPAIRTREDHVDDLLRRIPRRHPRLARA